MSSPCWPSSHSLQLFVAPWTIAHQALLCMGSPRQEYWSGLPFPLPRDLPDQAADSIPDCGCSIHLDIVGQIPAIARSSSVNTVSMYYDWEITMNLYCLKPQHNSLFWLIYHLILILAKTFWSRYYYLHFIDVISQVTEKISRICFQTRIYRSCIYRSIY